MNEKEAKAKAEAAARQKVQDALNYSGIAVNEADNDEVDGELVRERTRTLNNNPRNSDE